MKELLLAAMMMASRLSGLPVAEELPTMHFLPQDQMCIGMKTCGSGQEILGHYNFETRVLTLPTGWSSSDPYHMGTLLHETVHHLQAEKWPTKENRPCDGEIEKLAYATEHKFYELLGLPPDIDAMSLLFLTMCDD